MFPIEGVKPPDRVLIIGSVSQTLTDALQHTRDMLRLYKNKLNKRVSPSSPSEKPTDRPLPLTDRTISSDKLLLTQGFRFSSSGSR